MLPGGFLRAIFASDALTHGWQLGEQSNKVIDLAAQEKRAWRFRRVAARRSR